MPFDRLSPGQFEHRRSSGSGPDQPGLSSPHPRAVFVGYSAHGVPRFRDFAQWLLETKHPELDSLYQRPAGLVAVASSEDQLFAEVLPPFRKPPADPRLHGQVAAGFFELPGLAPLALTFQVQSSAASGHRRFVLSVLGRSEGGEALGAALARLGGKLDFQPPWHDAARWAESELARLADPAGRHASEVAVEARLHEILADLARRLCHDRRARERRTDHGERRHRQGDRPTHFALRDLDEAADGDVFADTRAGTLIVLGERGRAHVFTPAGKLVTSIRYTPESIGRKKKLEIWRPATPPEVAGLRTAAGGIPDPNADESPRGVR